MGPRDLVSIDVVVAPTYDLTDRTAYRASTGRAGITPHPKFFTDMDAVPYDHCRALADQARAEGFTALLVPSAAAKQETNLVIYFDVVAPRHVQIENGPDRLPLR